MLNADNAPDMLRSMIGTRLRCIAVVAAIALSTSVAEAQPAELFGPVEADEPPPAGPLVERTLRHRLVAIDFGQLRSARDAAAPERPAAVSRQPVPDRPNQSGPMAAPGATLTLNLFDDTVVTGLIERTRPAFSGGYSVAGHLVGEPLGTFVLVVNGATVAGTVRRAGKTYRIRSADNGLYAISEVDEPPLLCEAEEAEMVRFD